MPIKSQNISSIDHRVSDQDRWSRQGHKGGVLWLTGLPGSGKSTLAFELERLLFGNNKQVYVMDGDNLRHGLNSDLGFSHEDRTENIRRVGELAALYADAGMIVITAFISPYQVARQGARRAAGPGDGQGDGQRFHEIYLSASIEVCEGRDPKGHYKKARLGEIPDFTGVTAPYEVPENPELVIDTGVLTVADSLDLLNQYVENNFSLEDGPVDD